MRGNVAAFVHRSAPACITVISLLVLWQCCYPSFGTFRTALAALPIRIFIAMWQWRDVLMHDTGVTLVETLVGFGSALIIGVPIAAALVSSEILWRSFYPVLAGIQSIPKNAIAPLLILWFGTGQMVEGHHCSPDLVLSVSLLIPSAA